MVRSCARVFFFFALGLFFSAWTWADGLKGALKGSKPNLIFVMTDDQGYPPMSSLGHPWLKMPNLDRLGEQSAHFTHFQTAPTCAPTRSAIMTGRHPEKNGVTHTIYERERMALKATILPQVLKTVGYKSGIFGKWHLGDEAEYQPEKRGFDEVFIHGAGGIGQAYDGSCADVPDNGYFDPVIRQNGRFVKTHGFCTDVFFTAALGWIRERATAKEPFFAYISTNAPHGPFIAPEKNMKRFRDAGFGEDQAGFYGMVENIDENVGRLMAKLTEWGLDENTVLIFLSDNGMTGGGSGVPGRELAPGYPYWNAGMKGLKGSTDEGGTRVPFFIRWTGKITAGRDIDRMAAHIDILPTLADFTGVKLPKDQVEGRSLLPLLENAGADWSDRYAFSHVGRWAPGEDPNNHREVNFSVRSQRWRYVGERRPLPPVVMKDASAAEKAQAAERFQKALERSRAAATGPMLYDMENDPGQRNNVIAEHPEIAREMQAAYEQYWKEARPLMVNENVPLSPVKPYHEWYREQMANGGIPDWQPPKL